MALVVGMDWSKPIDSTDEILNEHTVEFIKQSNLFVENLNSGKQLESLVAYLSFLNDYSKYHFIYQESIMELKSFPGETEHKEEHKEFIYTVSKLFKDVIAYKKMKFFNDRDQNEGYKDIIETTYDFVSGWFRNHMSNSDKRFNDFLKFENL